MQGFGSAQLRKNLTRLCQSRRYIGIRCESEKILKDYAVSGRIGLGIGLADVYMMTELARKAWVVSIGHRFQNGKFVEFLFFYVGHPTKQSAVDALRRNIGPKVNLRRVKAERELSAEEIAKQSLQYRQVRYFAKRAVSPVQQPLQNG